MMMLPAVSCAAGHGCSVVCYLHVHCCCVYTWLGVLAGGGETQIDDHVIKTVDAKVFNLNGSTIFVQNGDAAYSSSKRQVIDYIYEAGPEILKNQQATAGRRIWMFHTRTVLPAAGAAGRQFFNVLSACWLCSWLCS